LLCKQENASHITAWVKSNNQSFYSISYTLTTTGGRHTIHHSFNPDFFILIKSEGKEFIVVVETKSDGDTSDENKVKNRFAKEHFNTLNEQLALNNINQEYIFHFISPNSYPAFFDYLRDGKLIQDRFRSDLEKQLNSEEE
jgi:type III restriction enzyme